MIPTIRASIAPLGARLAGRRARILLPLIGLLSLAWFLTRVVPRPSRAAYPCQRAALPLASGFVLWLAGVCASWVGLCQARAWLARGRFGLALVALTASLGAGGYALLQGATDAAAAPAQGERFVPGEGANVPMGTGQGIFPGRVVWIHDAAAARWDGQTGKWWDDAHTDPLVVTSMLSQGLQGLSGATTDADAWEALFRHFNRTHERGERGYQTGERLAVKLNLNQISTSATNGNQSFTAPQLVIALVRQLVEEAGVADSMITLYDATRYTPKAILQTLQDVAPGVRAVNYVTTGSGCEGHVRDPESEIRWSQELSLEQKGGNPTYLPRCVTEADYLINAAGLKGHSLAGVTLTAKNHFGSISASYADGEKTGTAPQAAGLHPYVAVHQYGNGAAGGGDWDFDGRDMGTYNALVDLIGHRHLGGKTLLYLIDGLYATRAQNDQLANRHRWVSEPFAETGWPSSLFVSQDPLAIDSVALDFLRAEPTMSEVYGQVDNYLHEAALADAAPSGTVYDPEGDGAPLASLGVHEHWNNPVDRQYSGNLSIPGGIELWVPGMATAVTDLRLSEATPKAWALGGYPNPFNPAVTLTWSQPEAGPVRLAVFDVLGRRVAMLHDESTEPGAYALRWDGTDDAGRPLASGIYFARLVGAGRQQSVTRLTLLR